MTTAAVVLAAGGGSRFARGEHKLLAVVRGKPVVRWVLDAVGESGCDEVVVVTGAVDLTAELGSRAMTRVDEPRWAEGQAVSLRAGIDAARGAGHDAVVVGLGDAPFVPAEAWRRMARATTSPIATATFGGVRHPPVRVARELWDLLPATGDEGARALLRERPDLVVEVPCPGERADIDTVEDLDRWS